MQLQQLQYQQKIVNSEVSASKNQAAVNAQRDEPFWGENGFTFGDILDMVNPLQHLPLVSKYYRELTGDDCSEGSKLIGDVGFGVLFGGATGAVGAMANTAIQNETQQDVSEHLMNFANNSLHSLDSFSPGKHRNESITQKETINPFFAQALDDANEYFPDPSQIRNAKYPLQQSKEMNPFFAALFDENANEYAPIQVGDVKSSGKDWGSV